MTPLARRRIGFVALALLWCGSAYGQDPIPAPPQIDMSDSFEVGELIRARFAAPPIIEGAKESIAWAFPPEIDFEAVDNGARVFGASTKPGKYRAKIVRTITAPWPVKVGDEIEWRDFTLPPYEYSHDFKIVGKEPEPDPDPEPDPEPKPGTLGALVPDAATRAKLVTFFADLATAVREGRAATTNGFREGYRKSIADGKASGVLPANVSVIDQPVSARIAAAIGLADAPMDEPKKTALAAALDAIAAEFR